MVAALFPLVVVDLQRIVTTGRPWAIDGVEQVVEVAARLVAERRGEVLATRHVLADHGGDGPWATFADRWRHLEQVPEDLDLVDELGHLTAHDKTTYSAYAVPAVRDAARRAGGLVVCGVETDCCIAATVHAAMEDDVRAWVVADAVLGPDRTAHEGTLRAFARLPDQVTVVTSAELLDRAG